MAEAVRRSGAWLLCRPGCSQCCMGSFAITELDARRLRQGLADLKTCDPDRAARILARASTGPPADDDPCPVLDPEHGTCDLYAARPITCRTFGPPVRCGDDAVGVCELCFEGASEEEIAACEVAVDPDDLESRLLREVGEEETTVAEALLQQLINRVLKSGSIMTRNFEWHDAKVDANLESHGVSSELAKTVFKNPVAVEFRGDREDYGEERLIIFGMAEGNILFVAYTERESAFATQHEQDVDFGKNS